MTGTVEYVGSFFKDFNPRRDGKYPGRTEETRTVPVSSPEIVI